jgi:hypothetical protein
MVQALTQLRKDPTTSITMVLDGYKDEWATSV